MDDLKAHDNAKDKIAQESAPQPPLEALSNDDLVQAKKSGKRRVLLLVAAGVAMLLVIAGLLSYLTLRSPGDVDKQTANVPQEITGQPDRLVYVLNNATTNLRELHSRSLESGDEVTALVLPEKTSAYRFAVNGDQVAFVAMPSGDSKGLLAIYYSKDSGRSYQKIYTVPNNNNKAGTYTRITSLIFSNDGKSLLAAILPVYSSGTANGGQVTEIFLEDSYPTKLLFTSEYPGVALQAYDSDKQQVVYVGGCYACEPRYKDIYIYDLAAEKRQSIYSADPFPWNIAVNNNFTKVLVLEGRPSSIYGAKVPYKLFEVDIATKDKVLIKAFDEDEQLRQANYTYENNPYYATNTTVSEIVDGQSHTLFELTGGNDTFATPWVLFAGERGVVGDVMTSIDGDDTLTARFSVMTSKPGDTTPIEVMKTGKLHEDMQLVGVTSK